MPIPPRLLLAAQLQLVAPALQVVHRVIMCFLLSKADLSAGQADNGAVTLIQRLGAVLSPDIHRHCTGLVVPGLQTAWRDGNTPTVMSPRGFMQPWHRHRPGPGWTLQRSLRGVEFFRSHQ